MVRLNVSAAQEQQAQQQQQPQQQQHHSNHNNHTHGHHSNNSKGGSSSHNGNGGGSNNSSKGGNKKSSSNNNNSNNNSNNVPSTSSSTSSLNSNASSLERAQGCNVMVVPQHQALPPPHQQQQQQQQQQYAHHGLHHGPHHHQHQQLHQQQQQQQQQQGQQQHSPSDGSNSSLPASPPLLQPAATPPQAAAQIVPPPVCAVHHPQQHQQQQLAIVAAMHQAAAAHLAAAGGALGPPHLHHAHHGPPPPPHGHSPQAGNAAVVQQQQQQQQQQQHSQQQHSHENGHPVPPGPGVSPSATGNGGSGGAVVAAPPPAPPPGPVYIQYPGEFYPAEYYIAPHPHDGMCPQHAHHHQPMCAMPSDYGPTTVQMVSQNRPPPMPVPVQVPQGQVVQPYVNESGALTHVVLSPQQYQQLHAGQGHLHAPFLTTNGTSHFYSPLPTGFPAGPGGGPTHFHAMPGGHLQQQPPPPPQQQQQPTQQQQQQQQQLSHSPHSPSPPNNYHKDERTQRQHTKLLRKLDQKQREINSAMSTPAHSPSPRKNDMNGHHNTYNSNNNNSHVTSTIQTTTTSTALTSNTNNHQNHHLNHQQQHLNTHHHGRRGGQRNGGYSGGSVAQHQHNSGVSGGASSVGTSEDGEESSSVAEDEDDYQTPIIEQLSAIQKPEVIDITSRSAKIIWEAPAITDPMLINQRDLRYNVLLSDRAKECKYKSLYKGESYDCIVQDLQPGQQYVVRLQVHYEKLQGSASEPTEFTTPPCEPDQPMPPKLVVRSKNSLHLRWTNPHANGSPIQHYLLEYDEGKTGAPASSRSARLQASQVQFVEAVKTKGKQYILTKLQPSTVYNFRLAAVNEVGSSMYSPICTYHTSGNPPTAPKPPTLQTVTSTSLRLTWERRQQDVEFVLQMLDQESGHGYLNMYNGSDCIYECCQLRRATAYQFRLRADNEAGASPWSTEVTYKTAPERPGHPGKPQVKGKIHGTYFKARWEPPADRGGAEILRYFLEICSGPKFERIYTGSEPEATCDRLQPGTTYQLRASCEGPAGISAYSEVATVTSEAIVPAAPPPPYYDSPPSPYAALLRLDKPDYNGGAPILEFEVQLRRAADMETEVELVETPTIIYRGKDSYCVAKDLKPGCSYEVQARALNRIGAGAWSSWFKFTAAPASPFAPEAPRVAVKSATQLTVNWSEPECNGSRISEYRLESAVVSGEDASKEASAASPPASSAFQTCYQGLQTTADLRNLLPFTLYYFRVNASNVAGVSKWSPLVNAMTPAAIPAAPQIKDYEFTANEVSLNWSEPDCNGSPITAYTIEYAERSITTPDASTEYTVTELTPETSYKFRVQAVNAIGAGPFSPYAKLTTLPPPPAPPVLECTGVGHNFIKLKWADGKNLALFNKFYVEMYVQRAKEFQVVYSGRNCMCKVNKLQEQTPYTFRICAGNDRAGVGDYSSEYIFSTTATLPSNIKAPRVAFEGNVTIVEHGSSTITGIASNIPSGQLPETPSSFIAGLGNLSFAVPLTLEWQHSKNSFSDRVEYVLQYAIGKDGDFKQIYRGFETKFTIENLEPGCMYQFRVCPIRVNSAGEDLPGQFTSAFRYQVPHLSSIDAIDSTLLSSAAGMLGAGLNVGGSNGNNSNNNSNASNASFHGHSHHSHHAHHSHGHSHHAHNHSHHSHHNSRHNGSSSTSTLHHRSVSASAVSTSGNGAGLLSGGNAIGFIPLGPSVTGSDFANFAGCDDPHHHHHHHHHPHQFHGVAGADIHTTSAATLLAATANTLLANNPLLANAAAAAAATHAQNGAMRRFTMKLTSLYTNRKRFTDQEKAVIFMVSFLFIAFVFAALVKMFMR